MKPLYVLLSVVASIGLCPSQAQAKPEFWNTFREVYAVKSGTPLDHARCLTCHGAAGPPERNPYGKSVEQALQSAHAKTLTPAILHQIETQDSDGDGAANGEEIAAGTLPGDPQSHPATGQPSRPTPPPPMPGMLLTDLLFPRHSFHPVLVHFPVALFLFGGFLEGWGMWKRRAGWREAGFLCLAGASISSLAAVATGFIAAYRNGFAFQGTALTHLVLALSATAGMAVTAILGKRATRAGRERGGWLYWLVLLISALLVGVAGHFGGMLVFG